MSSEIKLLSIDIDGTLIHKKKGEYDSHISEKNLKYLKFLTDAKINFVLSTGRNLHNIFPYAEVIQKRIGYQIPYFISMNGAIVYDNINHQILKHTSYEKPIYDKLMAFLQEKKYFFILQKCIIQNNQIIDEVYLKKSKLLTKPVMKHYKNNVIHFCDTPPPYDHFAKITIIFKISYSKKIKKILEMKFADELNFFLAGKYAIEVAAKTNDKFSGITFLCEKLNLNSSEVAAIGDQDNDYLSILKSGFGIGVDVAQKKYLAHIKAAAQFLTSNKNGEAVSNAIKQMQEKKLIKL